MIEKHIGLQFTEGTSDKVYFIQIMPCDNSHFMVQSQYGKRGKALRTFLITPTPVSRYTAIDIFNETVSKKRDKGYWVIDTPSEILTMIMLSD